MSASQQQLTVTERSNGGLAIIYLDFFSLQELLLLHLNDQILIFLMSEISMGCPKSMSTRSPFAKPFKLIGPT